MAERRSPQTTVGVVGLGEMGSRIAKRLLAGRYDVVVWNRSTERMAPLVELGATPASDPSEVARRAEVLITMVSDPRALRAVTEGPRGIGAGAHEGLTIIEMSTVGPPAVTRLARILPSGTALIDAPVLGSVDAADSGSLTVLAGGDPEVIERNIELLSVLGSVVRVGDLGAGAAAKLVANAALFGVLCLLGEALALAEGLGLSRAAAYRVLEATPLSGPADRRRSSIEAGDYPPRFKLRMARKDARLIRSAVGHAGVRVPLIGSAGRWFDRAGEEGLGDLDYTAVLAQILEQLTTH